MELLGIITDIVFRNEANGYTVGKLHTEDGEITIVGTAAFFFKDEAVKLQGEFIYHERFGEQFQFSQLEISKPSSSSSVEAYLASGLIRGIGPKTAKQIVKKFGEDSLDIIQYSPERLLELNGIGKKKLRVILESFEEQREMRDIFVKLTSYGLSTNQGMRIYKQYGAQTLSVVTENPYRLAEEVYGIGFRTADEIADKMGFAKDSPKRLFAGMRYAMINASNEGHCYLPKAELLEKSSKLLDVSLEALEIAFSELLFSQSFYVTKIEEVECIYYMPYHIAENNVAKSMVNLSLGETKAINLKLDKEIAKIEIASNIEFGNKQKQAIEGAFEKGVSIITGGPGTGKTTIINAIIKLSEKEGWSVLLAAPTGRAAKRITETTGKEAMTIHRLLEIGYMDEELQFNRDETNPLEADVIIVDEVSMIDIILMSSLCKAIPQGTRLILVGDVDQLPSVGPGNVLRDIINSGVVKVVYLDEIFRQAGESMIITNAHRINSGIEPILNEREKDFYYIYKDKGEAIQKEILELISNRLFDFYGHDPIKDIIVLSPMRKGEVGVNRLNSQIQERLNPPSAEKAELRYGETIYRLGDKVMQIRNNYKAEWELYKDKKLIGEGEGIFNGDIGYIHEVNKEYRTLKVMFDESKLVEYEEKGLDELNLAYATTIHKSQGSEFPVVVMPLHHAPPMLLTRNLLYTGITRAKSLVVLVGDRRYMSMMIKNNTIAKRYSSLSDKILKYKNELQKLQGEDYAL